MTGNTNKDRILAALRDRPGLDDDELSVATGVRPRQQVNLICWRLESRGFVRRRIGSREKIVNFLQGKIDAEHGSEPDRQAIALEVPLRRQLRGAPQRIPDFSQSRCGENLILY
jgi:hypothetical protein